MILGLCEELGARKEVPYAAPENQLASYLFLNSLGRRRLSAIRLPCLGDRCLAAAGAPRRFAVIRARRLAVTFGRLSTVST